VFTNRGSAKSPGRKTAYAPAWSDAISIRAMPTFCQSGFADCLLVVDENVGPIFETEFCDSAGSNPKTGDELHLPPFCD
jgi:hypothetical protein